MPILLQRFQAKSALLPCREPRSESRIDLMLPSGRAKSMRWKISHRGHDPRQIDLIAILALLIVIGAAYRFFSGGSDKPNPSALIVPSQSVRW
jgi:hypothetical protein